MLGIRSTGTALKTSVRLLPLRGLPLLTKRLATHTAFSTPHRSLSTTTSRHRAGGPPRFQAGSPTGLLSSFWGMVPDGAKTALAVIGGCAMLMVVGPLFFFVAPPLFVGGFFLVTRRLRKREREMTLRWEGLKETRLLYTGNPLDEENLQRFVKRRVTEAIELNEGDIANKLGLESTTNITLTTAETVDQDMRVSRDAGGGGVLSGITTISFGLLDKSASRNFNRIGTVLVTMRPRLYNHHLQAAGADCIIEVLPFMPLKKPIVIDAPSELGGSGSGRTINVKAKRTTRSM